MMISCLFGRGNGFKDRWLGVHNLDFNRFWVGVWRAVQASVTLLFAVVVVSIPIVIFGHGSQAEQIFSAGLVPTHPGQFATILNKMAASAFDNTGGNRPAVGEVGWVVHERQVALEVVSGFVELLALDGLGFAFLGHVAEVSDDLLRLAGEHVQGLVGHPIQTIGMGFAQQAIGDIP